MAALNTGPHVFFFLGMEKKQTHCDSSWWEQQQQHLEKPERWPTKKREQLWVDTCS